VEQSDLKLDYHSGQIGAKILDFSISHPSTRRGVERRKPTQLSFSSENWVVFLGSWGVSGGRVDGWGIQIVPRTPYNPVNAGGRIFTMTETFVPLILDRERIRFVYGEDQSQSSKPKFRR
jgi:hypothetical protein